MPDTALDTMPVMEALRSVIDPELGVNIVDLGLVYEIEQDDDGYVAVTMTTTTPACPIGSFLEQQVRWAVMRLPGVGGVEVDVVHTPPWSPARMTDEARETLGWSR
jgi:metal-sulfur cluster biosynthetic enzyme